MKKFNSQKNKFSKGVALLFAIVVSMILFTILAGVLNISFNESIFSISIKNSNDAFYAADSGAECALFNDKSDSTIFGFNSSGGSMSCFGKSVPVSSSNNKFNFNVDFADSGIGSCAKVTVVKNYDTTTDPIADPILISTTITSRGYNKGNTECDQTGLKSVERVLEVNY